MNDHEVRLPDFEISVFVQDQEVYRWSAWQDPNIHEGLHCLAGVESPATGKTVLALLQKACAQILNARWKSLDELGNASVPPGQERPF